MIYYICLFEDYISNRREGTFAPAELKTDGFIPCSFSYQVMERTNRLYGAKDEPCLLCIDPGKLSAEMKVERCPDSDQEVPRIYGAINQQAIRHISQLDRAEDGFKTPMTVELPPLVRWVKDFPAEVSVMAKDGTIVGLNDEAIKAFEYAGGEEVIGKNGIQCHQASTQEIIRKLLSEQKTHSYLRYKPKSHPDSGIFCYQSPWYENGEFMGLVEFVLPIEPEEIERFKSAATPLVINSKAG